MRFSRTALRACIGTVAAWTLALTLGGCGAGVVGTGSGTDDDVIKDILYTPLPLCEASFAATRLDCPPDGADFDIGTAAVQWSDTNKSSSGAAVLARLEVQTMTLQMPCAQVSFRGNWGALQDGSLAFVGRYTAATTIESRPAIVHVLPAPNEPDAVGWLQVVDASGTELFGPWLVRRVEGNVVFGECAP
ncbi:MAG: hypothetical protein QM722_15295 [Piscinibacter sp.]